MSEQEQAGSLEEEQQPRGAVRMIFEYVGDDVRLVSARRVNMHAPPTDRLEGAEEHQGLWAEVRDTGGATLHRQVLADPVRRGVEVFSDDPAQGIVRAPVERPSGLFVVLVPDLGEADHLALFGSSPGPAGLRAAANEILRVPLGTNLEGDTR
ncbi:MAG: hypothetical protein ACRDTA_23570 [Pseudonocardiaceae bacterium]